MGASCELSRKKCGVTEPFLFTRFDLRYVYIEAGDWSTCAVLFTFFLYFMICLSWCLLDYWKEHYCAYFRFFAALAPFRAFAAAISSFVGNCVSWSYANPPTEKHLTAHNKGDVPLSPALSAARTAKTVLMRYTTPRPLWKHPLRGVGRFVNGNPGYSTKAIKTMTNAPIKCPTCNGPGGILRNDAAPSPSSALTVLYSSFTK